MRRSWKYLRRRRLRRVEGLGHPCIVGGSSEGSPQAKKAPKTLAKSVRLANPKMHLARSMFLNPVSCWIWDPKLSPKQVRNHRQRCGLGACVHGSFGRLAEDDPRRCRCKLHSRIYTRTLCFARVFVQSSFRFEDARNGNAVTSMVRKTITNSIEILAKSTEVERRTTRENWGRKLGVWGFVFGVEIEGN
jgi:hypothetical protein